MPGPLSWTVRTSSSTVTVMCGVTPFTRSAASRALSINSFTIAAGHQALSNPICSCSSFSVKYSRALGVADVIRSNVFLMLLLPFVLIDHLPFAESAGRGIATPAPAATCPAPAGSSEGWCSFPHRAHVPLLMLLMKLSTPSTPVPNSWASRVALHRLLALLGLRRPASRQGPSPSGTMLVLLFVFLVSPLLGSAQ